MGSAEDYRIEDGVLVRYLGPGGDVTIPEGISSIGGRAFDDCGSLRSVRIPDSASGIGMYAFRGCGSLRGIRIPPGVKSIGYGAFDGCRMLKKVILPEGEVSIGEEAFRRCRGLADREGFVIVRGVLYDYFGPGGEVRIPEGVTEIGREAFYWKDAVIGVRIPESVTRIGHSAFSACRGLKKAELPEGPVRIGDRAFHACPGLADREGFVIVGGILFGWYGPGGYIRIPEGVTRIEDSVFAECGSLTGAEIPESVTGIGSRAFYGCGSLEEVRVPAGVTSMGEDAFAWCTGLRRVISRSAYEVTAFGYMFHMNSPELIYLGGPLSDLPRKLQGRAARGFLYAMDHGLEEAGQWKEGYLAYLRDHMGEFLKEAEEDRSVLLFLIREEVLDKGPAGRLLDLFDRKGDTEAKALLLQYIRDRSGGGPGDLSLQVPPLYEGIEHRPR